MARFITLHLKNGGKEDVCRLQEKLEDRNFIFTKEKSCFVCPNEGCNPSLLLLLSDTEVKRLRKCLQDESNVCIQSSSSVTQMFSHRYDIPRTDIGVQADKIENKIENRDASTQVEKETENSLPVAALNIKREVKKECEEVAVVDDDEIIFIDFVPQTTPLSRRFLGKRKSHSNPVDVNETVVKNDVEEVVNSSNSLSQTCVQDTNNNPDSSTPSNNLSTNGNANTQGEVLAKKPRLENANIHDSDLQEHCKCELCGIYVVEPLNSVENIAYSLILHVLDKHVSAKRYECVFTNCRTSFNDPQEAIQHVQVNHNGNAVDNVVADKIDESFLVSIHQAAVAVNCHFDRNSSIKLDEVKRGVNFDAVRSSFPEFN